MPRKPTEHIGIFGGTFDPIHFGHLRAVDEAREILACDRILLIPTADPPHKRERRITIARHRLEMLRKAIRGCKDLESSTIEIDRPGLSYTIDTLRALQSRKTSTRWTLFMGIDAFREIHTWKEFRTLFSTVDIAVLSRPPERVVRPRSILPVAVRQDFRYSPDRKSLVHASGHRVHFLSVTALDISATDIRDRVRSGRSIRFLTPTTVRRYIESNRLYRKGRPAS